ncbi:MAG: hypothetical protein AAGJ40_18075 [Planctomycetota bacterium]
MARNPVDRGIGLAGADRTMMARCFDPVARWWCTPLPAHAVRPIRFALAVITAAYFADGMVDAGDWFGVGQTHSSSQIAEFLSLAGIGEAVSASISPLFLTESTGVYQVYLGLSIALALGMAVGVGGRYVKVAVWLAVVFWSNRLLWLSGLAETSLSLSLASIAIAAETRPDGGRSSSNSGRSTSNGLSVRLLAVQASLLIGLTWLGMAAGDVWWDGTGAIALNAPTTNRTIDWTDWLMVTTVHDVVTAVLMVLPPLGLALAWLAASHRSAYAGLGMLWIWAALLALFGSVWIHAAILATGSLAIVLTRDSMVPSSSPTLPQ